MHSKKVRRLLHKKGVQNWIRMHRTSRIDNDSNRAEEVHYKTNVEYCEKIYNKTNSYKIKK